MTDYYQKSMRALQLSGKSESTQEAYTRSLRQLVEFYNKNPQDITEKELEDYFLHRENEDGWKPPTLRIAYSGIKFYFENILERDWQLFKYLKAKNERHLPTILSRDEVYKILNHTSTFHNYVFFSTVYACGLRLSEGLSLQVADIDGNRLMIHVHRGKGAKDRYVPISQNTIMLLREYWASHRNPLLIFPARGRKNNEAPTSEKHMNISSVQGAFQRARRAAGIIKRNVRIHTLRHCYATHLLEAGVNPRIIQRYMVHANLETTMIYFHLTQKGTEDAYNIIDNTMRGFCYANNNGNISDTCDSVR